MTDVKIAVDFDGTIVENKYPEIGAEKLFAFDALKLLQKKGFRLILWTFRAGKELEEAVEYCKKKGVEFYAVNSNYPEEKFDDTISRKIDADIYIDDKNFGGFPGWGEICQILSPEDAHLRNPKIKNITNERKSISSIFKNIFFKSRYLFIILLSGSILCSCSGGNQSSNGNKPDHNSYTDTDNNIQSNNSATRISSPADRTNFKIGQEINISVETTVSGIVIDSVHFYIDEKKVYSKKEQAYEYDWNTTEYSVGNHILRTKCFNNDSFISTNNVNVILLSDIRPKRYTYQVINRFPHDPDAFTQGLVYDNGFLYEGTGQYGESSIRKVNLETGEAINIYTLAQSLFGEGITIMADKLYQLTWKSQVGFVYDKESFHLLNRVTYPTQGWGITHDGENLIMSNGTSTIYYLDPEFFTEIKRLEVFNEQGAVTNINELEFINGKIYANVWQTDDIIIIDPQTGKVLGEINLKGILKFSERGSRTDVLNGIAYDPENDRIFVTGKYWTKLFEIKIKER